MLVALAACVHPRAALAPPAGTPPLLHGETFGVTDPARVRTLVIVLHGDIPKGASSYQYSAARAFAAAVPDSAVVALLRPGYTDRQGHQSPGERGASNGDNYTADRIEVVAKEIARLSTHYPDARVVIVGHGGGAAIAADLAGMHSGFLDGMVLSGCPCMLDEWRSEMIKRSPGMAFDAPVKSLDPLQTVGGIKRSTRVAILVGAADQITPPALSRSYAEALALRGIATDFRILPGKGHSILDDPETVAALQRLAAAVQKPR